MPDIMCLRTKWPPAFPDVIIHGDLADRDVDPDFPAAKTGDPIAAQRLVDRFLSADAVQHLKRIAGERRILLAAVSALEVGGFNAIPDAMARAIQMQTGWEVESGELRQANKVAHTRASGWHRLVAQAEFTGEVIAGGFYILVDDHIGLGGTLANLRGYIESRDGIVVAMTTLTETQGARRIALREQTLAALRARHGSQLEKFWEDAFGYGLDCCTELEAAYLCRQRSLDYVRRQLLKATEKARERGLSPVETGSN